MATTFTRSNGRAGPKRAGNGYTPFTLSMNQSIAFANAYNVNYPSRSGLSREKRIINCRLMSKSKRRMNETRTSSELS